MVVKNFKRSREDLDLKQKDIAKTLKVHFSTVSGWETGKDTIPLKQLIKYANHYKISLDYLLRFTSKNKYIELDVNLKEVGKKLRILRKRHSFTQEQIAERLNTSQSAYAHYEGGMYLITTYFLYALLKIYGDVSADYIFKK